jgi:AraC-like DNA-binding protein
MNNKRFIILIIAFSLLCIKNIAGISLQQADSLFNIDKMCEAAVIYETLIDKKQPELLGKINETYHKAGVSFLFCDNLAKALEYLIKSSELSTNIGDTYQAAKSQSNIAIIFQKKGNYQHGIEYNLKAVDNFIATESFTEALRIYNNIGIAYRNQGLYHESENYFKKSISIIENQNFDIVEKAPIFSNLALLEMNKENFDKALQYALDAWNIIEKTDNPVSKSIISAVVSEIYFKIKKGTLAEKFADISLNNSILSNNIERQSRAYFHLANAFELQNKFKEALKAHQLFKSFNDSIVNLNNEKSINELMVSYQTKEKENENIVLQQKNQIQEQKLKEQSFRIKIAIAIVVMLIVFSLMLLKSFEKTKRAYKSLVQKNIEIAKKHSETKQLITLPDYANLQKDNIIAQFENEIINKKEYLNSTISAESITNILQTNKTYLSNALNLHYGKNFQSIINEFRINEFISLLNENQHRSFTIESLAEKCGFNNRASFYSAFKKHTGITPSTFIKNMD